VPSKSIAFSKDQSRREQLNHTTPIILDEPPSSSSKALLSQTFYNQILSPPGGPGILAHTDFEIASGEWAASSKLEDVNCWIFQNDSLCAFPDRCILPVHICWPRQIRGPAFKGQKMNGLSTRYWWIRPSRNRSGPNSGTRTTIISLISPMRWRPYH